MALSPPNIVGCLSPLSRSVRLTGQIPGAHVEVQRNGTSICRAAATSFDEVYNFNTGVTLNPGDKITASQSRGADSSAQTPLPLEVQKLVPPFTGHRFVSHIYRCGVSLFIGGIVPGADVELKAGTVNLGTAHSVDGGAVVDLVSAIGNNSVIEARQIVGGAAGPVVLSPPADDPPPLHNFTVEEPLACAPGIMVHGVVDGAEILVRTDASDPSSERAFRVPVRDMYLPLPTLAEGQKLLIQEVMRRCELEGAEQHLVVGPMRFATKPVIVGPLCAGTVRLFVRSVFPGASLVVKQGGTVIGQSVAYAKDVEIWTSPLAGGQDVLVTASLCGATADSYGEAVDPAPATIGPCTVVEPLMDCSMQLWVRDAHAGGLLAVFSDQTGQISEWVRSPGSAALVNLVSPLVKGHRISVIQVACGSAPVVSANAPTVNAFGPLAPPVIEKPVFLDRPFVRALKAVPGALVQLYAREGGFISKAIADWNGIAALPRFGLTNSLRPGWHVGARQIMCDQVSELSEPFEEVLDRTPHPPVIVSPAIHATGVARRPKLVWSDPGSGTIHQASQFLVELSTPDHPTYDAWIVREVVTGLSFSLPQDLAHDGKYIWQVTAAVGDPGYEAQSSPSAGDFTVASAPPAPPDPPPETPGYSSAVLFNCNNEHRAVDVYKRDITALGSLEFVETLALAYDDGGFCPGEGFEPLEIDLPDGHITEIIFVDTEMIGCRDFDGQADPERPSCQRLPIYVLGKAGGPPFFHNIG